MNAEKFNPLDLIIASPPAVKAATGMVESTGNALINRPGVTEMTPGEPAPSSNPANPLIHSGPQPGYRQKNFFTDVKTNEAPEPKGLIGSGSVIPPEPGKSTVTDIHDEGPQLVNAQPLVTRGKGGRMQKSFTAAESTGQPLINPGPAWRGPGTEAPSVEPPRVIDNELQPQRSAEAQAAESPLIETNGEVLPPEKPKLGNGEETPEESRLMDEYARQHDLEHNPIEGESSKTHPLGDPENQNIEGDRLDYEQGKRENSKFEEPEQTDGGGGDQPPRNKPQAETPEGPEGKVLPGDFSLNQPTKFYHGSENPNLINTGLEANFPMGIHEGFGEKEAGIGGEHIPDDATHEDYTGVFMTDDPATADWWSRHYDPKTDGPVPGTRYEINMPRGSRMRLDPEESVLDPEKHDLVYNGDIPSGRVSTEEDRLDNKARQQELRQSEDQQLIRTNAIDRAEMYRGNKVYTSRKTGQQGYEPSPLGVRAPDEEIYPKLPELGSHSENIQPERRQDPNRRQLINSMTAEEMKKELLSSPTVDLPNRRAFNEIETHSPAKAVAMSDADGLKAFNDKFGYEAGDALLKAKAEALKEAGVDAYHDKGDEFVYRGKSPETLKQDLERAREILRNRTIEVTLKDGTVKRYKGADFSYGTGENLEQAESGLKTHKAAREQSGERARGELRGITEAGAKKDKPSKGSTK
jgi:GGDEF domain-containing protein